MKKLMLILLLLVSGSVWAQVPANDCGESATLINQCGTTFSVTQAQMANATDDASCTVGGSCPINYVNGTAYEDFDCDDNTGGTGGDDFSGSIENSLWWTFTPQESCDYDVTIAISNCCCKDKGPSNSAQYQIFDTDAVLPAGTIQNGQLAYQTGVVGTFTETISVTNGNPVYILLDGLNGTDCDISVSIQPTASCSGCVIALPIELMAFEADSYKDYNRIMWATGSETNNDYFTIEASTDGIYFTTVAHVDGAGNSSQTLSYIYNDYMFENEINYYRLKQTDFDGKFEYSRIISVDNRIKEKKIVRTINLMGVEVDETYKGIVVEIFEDGSTRKVARQ